jgi:hypothetical protein
MNAENLPAGWGATANSLEMLAFYIKEALLVIDDFNPHGSMGQIAQYHQKADQVFRAASNNTGRDRLHRDGNLGRSRPPRGQLLSSGEDVPRGQSLRARLMTAEVILEEIDKSRLTTCQKQAARGVYAAANAAWIQWLAGRYDRVIVELATRRQQIRDEILQKEGCRWHGRTPTAVAHLLAAWELYLKFVVETGAKSEEEAEQLKDRVRAALLGIAEGQTAYQEGADAVTRCLSLLRSVISSGQGHIAGMDGRQPQNDPSAWGWREDPMYGCLRPQGIRLGWVEGEDLYLDPEVAYVAANKLGAEQGEPLPVSSDTLKRRLKEAGMLKSMEERRLTVRISVEGRRRYVLHLRAPDLWCSAGSGPSEPSGPGGGDSPENRAFSEGRNGPLSSGRPEVIGDNYFSRSATIRIPGL